MDMSLEDIIRNKGIGNPTKKFPQKKSLPIRNTLNRPTFKEKTRVTDARLKIIQKNRAKIRDARDKLAEITRSSGDARQRLLQKQRHQNGSGSIKNGRTSYRNGYIDLTTSSARRARPEIDRKRSKSPANFHTSSTRPAIIRRRPEVVDIPRGYVDYDNMEHMEEEEYVAATRLSRTVKNDMAHYADAYENSRSDNVPPAPRRLNSWGSTPEHYDPFEVYEVPIERHTSNDIYQRRYIPEPSSHLSYEMRSRLERAPDPHVSMGIFSNPLKTTSHLPQSSSGYRIVVSNLHTSVSQSDIKELFEDIGELYDSRIVRPGVAEVIYKSLTDAEKAVDTYHNRQLDGQPMKCLLVNPRASNKPTAPAIKTSSSNTRINSGKTPLEVDIDALHKVLFRNYHLEKAYK